MVYKCRIKEEIEVKPEAQTFPRNNLVTAATLNSTNDIISLETTLVPECASGRYEYTPSLECLVRKSKKSST